MSMGRSNGLMVLALRMLVTIDRCSTNACDLRIMLFAAILVVIVIIVAGGRSRRCRYFIPGAPRWHYGYFHYGPHRE